MYSHNFCNSFDTFHKECFDPMAFIYVLFFVNNIIVVWEQRIWIYDYSDSNESRCLYGFSFNISYFCSSFFCSFQFVIKFSTALDIIIFYRLMWWDLNSVHIWCLSFYIKQLSYFNLMNRRLIFFVKWAVIYKSLQWDLS